MESLLLDFSYLDGEPTAVEDLDEAAAALAKPDDWNSVVRWSNSFEALDALRTLINTLASCGVFVWPDGTTAGLSASFDSDGECTDTDGITITLLLPIKRLTGRFGVFVALFIGDIDDLLLGCANTAREQAESLLGVLNDAITDMRALS